MKPVEFVSIGGYVFSLEEDACAVVRKYLDELTTFYKDKESGSEVMEGIEERMCELLLEQSGKGGVVTLPMCERVIATLGKPEAIEQESGDFGDARTPEEEFKVRRKLYRDPSNGMVAGVCSGLGTYFEIDPTILRILFVVLSLVGFGFFLHKGWFRMPDYLVPIIYIILWICMPVAKTVQQRDELRGEKGTVDAISARVQSSIQEMGEVASNVARSDSWKGLGRFFGILIGIIFLVTGVAGVVSLGCMTLGEELFSNTFILNRAVEEIANDAPVLLDFMSFPPLVAALSVVLVIPFIWLIYTAVMLLFDLKAPKWHPGLCLLVIWLVALTVLAVLGAMILFKGSL
jgi:phage shock protein PspC (stress-responsive transcriptional regulator)